MKDTRSLPRRIPGFTIVELLVVIVIIAILATLTIVSYIGITRNATIAALKSELVNASRQINLYNVDKGYFPDSISDCPNPSSSNLCIQASNGVTFSYTKSGNSFTLEATSTNTNPSITYQVKDNNEPKEKSTSVASCPSGFIPVPGSSTYGTSDFCVAKYEAKHYNSSTTVPISTASGNPWTEIAQSLDGTNNDAIEISQNAVDQSGNLITGAHLITEAEWMTIAQNVLSVASNWSGGAVGSGFIFNGYVSPNPDVNFEEIVALPADANDANGLFGMTSTGSTVGGNSRRTLTLTNGEVIWDLSGNVAEWTQGQISGGQPGLTTDTDEYPTKQWNDPDLQLNGLPVSSVPSSTEISGITWNYYSGIGTLWSDYNDVDLHSFMRGGCLFDGGFAGVLNLGLGFYPEDNYDQTIGFRIAK